MRADTSVCLFLRVCFSRFLPTGVDDTLLMIFKMTAVTALYVLLTALLWKRTQGKAMTVPLKLFIGLIYGLCAILGLSQKAAPEKSVK